MDTAKIKAIIAELEADIGVKANAINSLKALLASSDGASRGSTGGTESLSDVEYIYGGSSELLAKLPGIQISFADRNKSYVELAVAALEATGGKPMRMVDIFNWIKAAKSNPHLERRSVEATVSQHVKKKGERSRIVRVSPGVYGLRRYPRTAQTP